VSGRPTDPVRAAGAVLWRPSDGEDVEIAVIHRPRYDDWSLPKGKIDSGETAVEAAVREIAEETGIQATLRRYLRPVTYPISGEQTKTVDYWSAEANSGDDREFVANSEVDRLRWLPVDRAVELLSYEFDRTVVAEFRRLPARTRTVLLVRHAKAGRRDSFHGDDRLRPLERAGQAQAHALVPMLRAFGANSVHSADPVRCVQTVQPLAGALGVRITLEPALSETAYARDRKSAEDRLRKIAALGDGRVVCSQGKVIPDLLATLAEQDGMPLPQAPTRKGSFWVLSVADDNRFLAADYQEGRK
jgi:8-oxo-dGTP diphosphatase